MLRPSSRYTPDDLLTLMQENKLAEVGEVVSEAYKEYKQTFTLDSVWDTTVAHAARVAVETGNVEAARVFFSNGVNVNSCVYAEIGKHGSYQPFLYFATCSGSLAMVRFLVEEPFNANVKIENNTHMDYAIRHGFGEIVEYFLEKGVSSYCEEVIIDNRWTHLRYLEYAALNNHFVTMDALIRYGRPDSVYDALCNARRSYDSAIKHLVSECWSLRQRYSSKGKDELMLKTQSSNTFAAKWATDDLNDFEVNKAALAKKVELLAQDEEYVKYTTIVRNLMDYAVGHDIGSTSRHTRSELSFLQDMVSVAGINFIGVTIEGIPVTKALLQKLEVAGFEQAITTIHEIDQIADSARCNALKHRISDYFEKQSQFIIPSTSNTPDTSPSTLRANSLFGNDSTLSLTNEPIVKVQLSTLNNSI